MKLINKKLITCLFVGFFTTQLAYTQHTGKNIPKKMVGTWIFQRLDTKMYENSQNNPEAQKQAENLKNNNSFIGLKNKLAFSFEKNGTFIATFIIKEAESVNGVWSISNHTLLMSSSLSIMQDFNGTIPEIINDELHLERVFESMEEIIPVEKFIFVFKKGSINDLDKK